MCDKRIVIVEDEAPLTLDLKSRLQNAGYTVSGIAYSGEQALELIRKTQPDLVLMDINLGMGIDGIETAGIIYEEFKIPVVFMTAYTDFKTVRSALETNPYGYLTKPVRESELLISLQMAFRKNEADKKLHEANQKLLKEVEERKKVEKKLRVLFRAIEQSPSSIVITDRDGTIEYVNPAFTKATDYTFDEAVGENPRILKPEEKKPEEYKEFWDTLTGKKVWQGEFLNVKKNGEYYWEWASVGPVLNEEEEITHFVAVKEDITERKKAEEAVKVSEQSLREANAMKDKLFSIIAHDLRNAFTVVLSGSYLLAEHVDKFEKAKVVKYAKNMSESAEKIDKLLDNLLTWSRLQMDKIKMNPAEIDLAEAARLNINLFREYAKQKKVTLDQSIPNGIFAYADHDMLDTVLRNLINNALKFSHPGGKVQVFISNENEDFIEIGVSDTGVGIEEEYCEQVFKIDSKFKEKGTAGETGNGLGLPLCKEFIEKNGGEIRVESEFAKGSTFKFTLPKFKNKK